MIFEGPGQIFGCYGRLKPTHKNKIENSDFDSAPSTSFKASSNNALTKAS
jgi:hypothetical protein